MFSLPIIITGLALSPVIGAVGITGTGKRIFKYIKGDESSNGLNNKIQSLATLLICAAVAVPAFFLGSPITAGLVMGFGLLLNTPYVAKIFAKDSAMRTRLDNLAGTITGIFNRVCFIPFAAIATAAAL
ncbi:MAG: hypothetical protein KR126chlam6_00842 [Candidatus Anoxychlamydiales bacterium]|nr:hypothetical protein [Candidatus Anoxychlamydiales bacterium]